MSILRLSQLTRLTLTSTMTVGALWACNGDLTSTDDPNGSGGSQSGDGDGDLSGDGDGDTPGDGDGDAPGDGDGDAPGDGDGDGMGGDSGTGGEPGSGGMPATGGLGGMGGGPSNITCDAGTQDNDDNGSCEADCSTVTCEGDKICSDASGSALCSCASGLQDNDGDDTCVVDCTSAGLTCGTGASCDDTDGTAACACELATDEMDGAGNCSGCITGSLTLGATAMGDLANLTNSVVPTCNSLNDSGDALYTFAAAATGNYFFTTNGSDFDTVLSAHNGAACGGQELACDDESGVSGASVIRVPLAQTQSITLAVNGWNSVEGNYEIRGMKDTCDTPVDLGSALGTNLSQDAPPFGFAVRTSGICSGDWEYPEVYYRWTAPSTGDFVFSTEGSDFDTVLSAYADCEETTEIACDDDGGVGVTSELQLGLTEGDSIILVIGAFFGTGTAQIGISAL